MKENGLLTHALKHYPIGIHCKSAYDPQYDYHIMTSIFRLVDGNVQSNFTRDKDTNSWFYVYYNGRWAEILSYPVKPDEAFLPETSPIISTYEIF